MKIAVKRYYKYITAALAAALAALAAMLVLCAKTPAYAEETGYEIYPVPHSVVYGDGEVTIPSEVNIRFGEDIDSYTQDHAYSALSMLDVLAYKNGSKAFTVYVGVAGSGDEADSYVSSHSLSYASGLFDKIDAYYLHVGADAIVVLGKSTDAAYYGISTLKYIFPQLAGNKIKKLDINDWADTQYRGFLEGFYGIPWTTDERVAVMEVGSAVKANMYMYAPKDDPYHAADWRSLYSDADLAELKVQIEAGKRTKVKFSWSIHPYQYHPITAATYVSDLATLKRKFQQVYDAGVRNFIISADDIDIDDPPDEELQRDLLNDIAAWLREKGDCGELMYVPCAYCLDGHKWSLPRVEEYYPKFMPDLDETVQIMWTGKKVTSSLANGKFQEFTQLTGRKPFVWFNWPVNDYAQDYLMLGPAEVLNVKYEDGEPAFSSLLFNPHVQAGPAVVPMFSVGDFCWNINAFDCTKSWKAAIRFVEKNEPDAYEDICAQSTNTIHKFEDYSYGEQSPLDPVKSYPIAEYWDESTDFVPLISAFEQAVYSGDDATQAAAALKARFDLLIEHCQSFLQNASNTMLRDRVRPWVNCLMYIAEECSHYLSVYTMPDNATNAQIGGAITAAEQARANRENCKNYRLEYITYTRALHQIKIAPAVLTPFAEEVAIMAKDEYCIRTGEYAGITFLGFNGVYHNEDGSNGMAVYTGTVEDAVDDDLSTFLWLDGIPTQKSYIRFDLGAERQLDDVHIYSGHPTTGRDVIYGKVEYSVDGRVYTEFGDITGAETHIDRRLENLTGTPVRARYIRIRPTGEGWVTLREVQWNRLGALTSVFSYSGYTEYNVRVGFPTGYSSILNVTDGNADTYFDLQGVAGAARTLDLEFVEPTAVRNIKLLTGDKTNYNNNPALKSAVLSVRFLYSYDGTEFIPFNNAAQSNAEGEYNLNCEEVTVKKLRAEVLVNNEQDWILVRMFAVSDQEDGAAAEKLTKHLGKVTPWMEGFNESNIYVTGVAGDHIDPAHMCDGDYDTCTWITFDRTAGTHFVLDLFKNTAIETIDLAMANNAERAGDYMKSVVFSYSTDGENWTEIAAANVEILIGSRDSATGTADIQPKAANGGQEIYISLNTNVTARYIKAQVPDGKNDGSNGIWIREFNVNVDRDAFEFTYSGYDPFVGRINFPSDYTDISHVTDGNENTYFDLQGVAGAARILTLDIKKVKTVRNIKLYTGDKHGYNDDSLKSAVTSVQFMYSADGAEYRYFVGVHENAAGNYNLNCEPVNARYIRAVVKANNVNDWILVRLFMAFGNEDDGATDTISVLPGRVTPYMTLNAGTDSMYVTGVAGDHIDPVHMCDGDYSSATWLTFDYNPGTHLILDLYEAKAINNIDLAMASGTNSRFGDYMKSVVFYYSADGENWTALTAADFI